MEKKSNWMDFLQILEDNGITKLYHFTDRDNLESIIKNGGLYSWKDCEEKGIIIAKPGGSQQSRNLPKRARRLKSSAGMMSSKTELILF